ncbi:MAG: ATP-binding cassette domain-containing protein, partial [Bacteroidota bacterium]
MSDRILKALMQLFAIVANADEVGTNGREIVERFLKRQLSSNFVQQYLLSFDSFLEQLRGKADEGKIRKRISVNSVKVLRICNDINKELDHKQKLIVLIRLLEFVKSAYENLSEQQLEFIKMVADTFSISETDYNNCLFLCGVTVTTEKTSTHSFLILDKNVQSSLIEKHIQKENLAGEILFLFFEELRFFVFKYSGSDQLFLNGRAIVLGAVDVFEQGSVIRSSKLNSVFYNDIIHQFILADASHKILFEVKDLGYSFRGNKIGLHDLNFTSTSGNLISIMGNSGAGKTTLLTLLNGSIKPTKGKILINGIDLHSAKNNLHVWIGNIPQDDLLIEELTVFQNLFYSAKLYFGKLSNEEIEKKVNECLISLGLFESKDLTVGDPLNKYISGGQRKRLNIALELIRQPEILFVDEPTSGLSSNDAENVMDLLKQLSLSGKLVFVVIHQPSSDIFKLFDQLLILDTGGFPVFYGNPVDSLSYFKQQMNFVDYDNSECVECGNINPEENFKIIESKTVDEYG